MGRDLKNMNHEDAKASGWEILKELGCEVVGKAVYKDGDIEIMKSTKRWECKDREGNFSGWIYNTSTEYRKGENISVAEALVFVPA